MAHSPSNQLVTANRLRDGVPVYYAGVDRWSPVIADALLVAEAEAESLLAAAEAGPAPRPVVAPYLIDAVRAEGAVQPQSLRERIRAFGPTV
jgi:hypothetical protein